MGVQEEKFILFQEKENFYYKREFYNRGRKLHKRGRKNSSFWFDSGRKSGTSFVCSMLGFLRDGTRYLWSYLASITRHRVDAESMWEEINCHRRAETQEAAEWSWWSVVVVKWGAQWRDGQFRENNNKNKQLILHNQPSNWTLLTSAKQQFQLRWRRRLPRRSSCLSRRLIKRSLRNYEDWSCRAMCLCLLKCQLSETHWIETETLISHVRFK